MKQSHKDLINIQRVCPQIWLDIRYATSNNIAGKQLYPFPRCYVLPIVADKLIAISKALVKLNLGLKIFDGFRPLAVQKVFWNMISDERYVSNPAKGGRHTRGTTVDATLVDLITGKDVDMPSEFDDMSERAHANFDSCTNIQKKNRTLLKEVMESHGFVQYPHEWWHFDIKDWERYPVLDLTFEGLEGS